MERLFRTLLPGSSLANRTGRAPRVPLKIHALLRSCLRKDERRRLRDIAYARVEIEEARSEHASSVVIAAASPKSRDRFAWALLPMAALLVIAMVFSAYLYFRSPQQPEEITFDVSVPPMPNPFDISVSPDGRKIAFVAMPAPGRPLALFVRQMGSVTPRQIAGTEGATAPFWSPDSRYIGFAAGGTLKKVDVLGGAPQNLCPAPAPFTGGTWNKEGDIVFGSANPIVLRRVLRWVQTGGDHGTGSIPIGTGTRLSIFLARRSALPVLSIVRDAIQQCNLCGLATIPKRGRSFYPHDPLRFAEPGYLLFQREGHVVRAAVRRKQSRIKWGAGPALPMAWPTVPSRRLLLSQYRETACLHTGQGRVGKSIRAARTRSLPGSIERASSLDSSDQVRNIFKSLCHRTRSTSPFNEAPGRHLGYGHSKKCVQPLHIESGGR